MLRNENLFKQFIKKMIPELERDEVIIGLLAARKKYAPEISRSAEIVDKIIVKRKEDVFRKFRRFMRVEKGDYIDFKTGNPIPVDAMVCYIDLNPRSSMRALNLFQKEMNDWVIEAALSEFDLSHFRKLDTKVFSALARRVSRRMYFLVDIDDQNPERYLDMLPKPLWITQTRGGFHLIYPSHREIKAEIFNAVSEHDLEVEVQRDTQTPVPGSLQGGVEVKRFEYG